MSMTADGQPGEAPITGDGGPLPLEDLDRALRPLRRVVAFAMRDLDRHTPQVRYLEANGGRWVQAALHLDLPHAIRDVLATVGGKLSGFDAAELDERKARLRAIYQGIARVDAQLGLPLDERVKKPVRGGSGRTLDVSAWAEDAIEYTPGPASAEVEPETSVEDEDDRRAQEADRRLRFGDPAGTGRPVSSLGGDLFDGSAGAELLATLADEGVETVGDLLLLPPIGEDVVRPVHGAGRDIPVGRVAVGGRVRRRVTRLGDVRRTEILLAGAGPLRAVWAGGAPSSLVERFSPGSRVVLVGDLVQDETVPEGVALVDPEPAVADGHAVHLPKYGVEGLDDRFVRRLVGRALPEAERLRDTLPSDMLARTGLPPLGEAVRDLHTRGAGRPEARRRLAFEEALLVQLGLASPRFQASRERGIVHGILHGMATRVCLAAEIVLDDAQQLALEDIKRDLRDPTPMLRVLTGNAGSGKGLVALLAAIVVAESKSQVLVLAPDTPTAEQRFLFAEPLLREVGLVGRVVIGEPSRAQRDAIRRGEVHVVFGAVDLLDMDVEFRRLGLVVAEEREVHGRAPAKMASFRAPRPDLLVFAPTPVPSAVLLSAYGDHDLSVVDGPGEPAAHRPDPGAAESPHGGPVRARMLQDAERDQAYRRAAEAIREGRQVFVVFPQVRGGGDVLDIREAARVVEMLEAELFPARPEGVEPTPTSSGVGPEGPTPRVGLYHGAMSRDERYRVYDDFRHHRLQVLVGTAPIEDGPPVPAATIAIVEQADRMPLQRLMRLRGHVAVVPGEGELLLVVGREPDPEGVARVERLVASTQPKRHKDGREEVPEADDWALAEWELHQRGLEGMLAREVPSAARLRWLDPSADRELLILARAEAHRVLEDDPGLRRGQHGDLARALRDRWEDLLSTPYPLPEAAGPGAAAPRKRRRRRKRR